jgi:hypothetical protein
MRPADGFNRFGRGITFTMHTSLPAAMVTIVPDAAILLETTDDTDYIGGFSRYLELGVTTHLCPTIRTAKTHSQNIHAGLGAHEQGVNED